MPNHVTGKTIASQFQGPICRGSLMLKFERAPGWRRLSKDLIDGAKYSLVKSSDPKNFHKNAQS